MSEIHWTSDGLRVRCGEQGFAVIGPDFHVWDERLPAALESARLLRRPRAHRAGTDPEPRVIGRPPCASQS